ncbi:hypothetical protein [Niabella aurantiaca]|uniref:hypothetical protein n=1 Tax=Niabella aurantiaca TaxID=379900 RepID=UPI000376332F|nr:hypothetical protein [Niabella aurantiaca]
MNNAVATPTPNANPCFNEAQWLQVLFLLADTQSWLHQMQEGLIWQLPVKHRKKLLRQGWYLSAKVLAHILERHYYKVPRHPLTGKFTLPIPQIVACIRDACQQPPEAVPRSTHLQRVWDAGKPVGYDPAGSTVTTITVIATASGEIMTAFPGLMPPPQQNL